MIEIKNVSMRFNLEIEKDNSLKKVFIKMLDIRKWFKKTNKKNNDFWALKNIDLNIKKGAVVGIIGPNGAGKSTLLKIIAGVYKPTKGKVTVNGKVSPMIELGAGFDGELTARENIYLNGAILGYSNAFIDEKFDDIVEFSEIRDFLDVPVKNFSSGMVAKLAFSISTVVNPEVLIVDEILSVGDLKFRQKSEQKMMDMIQDEGTTVVYVSHSLESIRKICQEVVWIDHGKIVMQGKTDKVCDAYYENQIGGNTDDSN